MPAYIGSKPIRVLLLVELVAAFIAVLGVFSPVRSSMRALEADVTSGRTHVIDYDDYGDEVAVQWRTVGPFPHQFMFRPRGFVADRSTLPSVMVRSVRRGLHGSGQQATFRSVDLTKDFGGIGVLALAAYPLLIPWPWLCWLTVSVGLFILVETLLVAPSGMRFSWFWICLSTGLGFYAWLWFEPAALWPATSTAARTVRRALARSAISAVVLVAFGALLVSTNLV